MQLGGPVIIYRIMYDDGEEVTAPAHTYCSKIAHMHSLMHGTSSRASGTHAHRCWRTCARSGHEGSVR